VPPQVSVAILLDKFVQASSAAEEEKASRAMQAIKKSMEYHKNTLDPLLAKLALDYVDDADLSNRLRSLFKVPPALRCAAAGRWLRACGRPPALLSRAGLGERRRLALLAGRRGSTGVRSTREPRTPLACFDRVRIGSPCANPRTVCAGRVE
jgi:hypothetical protein